MRRIYIFDTTLRDGEQAPGASMSIEQKLIVAKQLERLNIDVIEAGFPVSSPVQFEAVKLIAQKVRKPIIAGLARSVKKDIDACRDALKDAKKKRLHLFIATSDIHMKYKLKKEKKEVIKMAVEAVRYGRKFFDDIEFSCEDATRSDREFLAEIIEKVIKEGANVINIPDTVGYTIPEEFESLIKFLKSNVDGINDIALSVHCHNDLGLASANSLAAIRAGASQVECTINGIGERAGNAAMEEIVLALYTRQDIFKVKTNIKLDEIWKTSRLVSGATGFVVQPNKAIVGKNAFTHESGIHQDGVLKERQTYEIISPATIGRFDTEGIVLGRHSGKHGFSAKISELGIKLTKEELERAYIAFLEVADKKKRVYVEDILAIVGAQLQKSVDSDKYVLDYFNVDTGNTAIPTACVRLKKGDKEYTEVAIGDGPVDALLKAIDKITGKSLRLVSYNINAVTSGKDAVGEVNILAEYKDEVYSGYSAGVDVIEISAKAYLNIVNKLI